MSLTAVDNKHKAIREALPQRLFTIEQSVPYLGQADHWGVRNLINNHGLKTVRYGTRIMLDKADMDDWIEKHRHVVTY